MITQEPATEPDAVPDGTIVTVNDLTKTYKHAGEDIHALDGVTLALDRYRFTAVTGPSGSGKTTLLYQLGALDRPTSGSITLDGIAVTSLSRHQQNSFRQHRVGFVFQAFNLIPNLSMLENVTLPMELADTWPGTREERGHELLEMVGLERPRHGDRVTKLSAGQQQRVAIARSLANNPSVILADEPTGNLDSKNGRLVVDILRDLVAERRATVILVTHDPAVAAAADRRIEMQDGKIVRG